MKQFGLSKTTVLRWEKEGKIPLAHRDEMGWRYWSENEFQEIVKQVSFRISQPRVYIQHKPLPEVVEAKPEKKEEPVYTTHLDFLPKLSKEKPKEESSEPVRKSILDGMDLSELRFGFASVLILLSLFAYPAFGNAIYSRAEGAFKYLEDGVEFASRRTSESGAFVAYGFRSLEENLVLPNFRQGKGGELDAKVFGFFKSTSNNFEERGARLNSFLHESYDGLAEGVFMLKDLAYENYSRFGDGLLVIEENAARSSEELAVFSSESKTSYQNLTEDSYDKFSQTLQGLREAPALLSQSSSGIWSKAESVNLEASLPSWLGRDLYANWEFISPQFARLPANIFSFYSSLINLEASLPSVAGVANVLESAINFQIGEDAERFFVGLGRALRGALDGAVRVVLEESITPPISNDELLIPNQTPSSPPTAPQSGGQAIPAPTPKGVGGVTIIDNTTTAERIIEKTVVEKEITSTEAIDALRAEIYAVIANLPAPSTQIVFSGPAASTPISTQSFALSQKIDQLTGVDLNDITVDGVSGLTDDDIPNSITVSGYLPLGGGSLANLTVGSTTVGILTATSSLTVTGSATSTFANGIALSAGCFQMPDGSCLSSSGGDATTLDGIDSTSFLRSDTSDNFTSGTLTFNSGTTLNLSNVSPSVLLALDNAGNVVASTTPYVAAIHATSTATSTFVGGASLGGLASNNGLTISGGSFQNTSSASSFFTGNVGIGTAAPSHKLHLYSDSSDTFQTIESPTANSAQLRFQKSGTFKWAINSPENSNNLEFHEGSNGARVVFDSSGNVGIGTTTPGSILSVQSVGNFQAGTSTMYSGLVVSGINATSSGVTISGGSLLVSSGATSTFANGIKLTGGCFELPSGQCAGTGGDGGTPGGSDGQIQYNDGSSFGGASGFVWDDVNNFLGIGSTTPFSKLSLDGDTWLNSNLIRFASSSASSLVLSYLSAATSTIPNDSNYAWSIATSTTASPIFRINTALNGSAGAVATTSVRGGFVLDNGAFNYNSSAGVVSIDSLTTGPMAFDTDAGILSWIDMPSSTTTADIVNSYSAQIDSTPILTIYGTTTTSGNITYGHVGVGTTSPWRTLSVTGSVAYSSGITDSNSGQYLCINTSTFEVTRNNTACSASSLRFKENIEELEYGLDDVLELRPVTFNFKPEMNIGTSTYLGFIAEEMALVIPELTSFDKNGLPSGIDYPNITVLLTKAVQELNLNLATISSSTASSTPKSQSFAGSFFGNLFSRVSSWLADAANGIGDVFANVFRAGEKICVDDQCLTREDVEKLLELVGEGGSASVPSSVPPPPPPPASPENEEPEAPEEEQSEQEEELEEEVAEEVVEEIPVEEPVEEAPPAPEPPVVSEVDSTDSPQVEPEPEIAPEENE